MLPFFNGRASVLSSVSETLKGFIIIYEGFSSFAEIFSPISNLLHEVLQNPNLPGLLRDKMQDVLDLIKKKTDEHHMFRKPLQMRKQKPVPIKLLNPKFEEKYVLLNLRFFVIYFSYIYIIIINRKAKSFYGS